MLLWQRGGTVKNKNSPHPKRDEGCLCIKLRGTTQIAKDKSVPCRFRRVNAALRPTCVAGSSGVARNDPDRNALQLEALSLNGGVHF